MVFKTHTRIKAFFSVATSPYLFEKKSFDFNYTFHTDSCLKGKMCQCLPSRYVFQFKSSNDFQQIRETTEWGLEAFLFSTVFTASVRDDLIFCLLQFFVVQKNCPRYAKVFSNVFANKVKQRKDEEAKIVEYTPTVVIQN